MAVQSKKPPSPWPIRILLGLLFLAGSGCVGLTLFALYHYQLVDKVEPQVLGNRADFFTGFATPILTFLTLIGILITISLQRQELVETRREISRQADALETQLSALASQTFEATFFQMLTLQSQIVEPRRIRSPSTADN